MQDLTNTALDIARGAGATFADIRIVDERRRHIFARRRSLRALRDDASLGYAVRVLVDGAWGFASATRLERDEVARTAERAVRSPGLPARAQGRNRPGWRRSRPGSTRRWARVPRTRSPCRRREGRAAAGASNR